MGKENNKKIIAANENPTALVKRLKRSLADLQGEWILDKSKNEETIGEVPPSEDNSKDSIYKAFAKKIASIKRLSDEEERALGRRIQAHDDNAAKKKLVLHNMRLALKMAHQYRREWTSLMDLVQEASAGMAIAAQKWDPEVGTRFGTYAGYWIRAQLTKFLMTNSRLIHTANTRAGRKVYYSLPQIRKKLMLEGKKPTAERIAKEINEDPKEVSLIISRLKGKEASLSAPIDDDGANTLEDTLSNQDDSPEKQAVQNEMAALVKNFINGFEKTIKNERDLVIWRENLIANDPINLVELGKRFGVSKQRMGQLSTRLKRSFRRYLVEHLGERAHVSWLFRED